MSERAGRAGWPDRRDYGKLPDLEGQNPRDVLANALNGETRGSLKVQALADWAALEGIEAKFLFLQKQEILDIHALMEAATEKAAIKEAIRLKKFGEDAKEYKKAFGFGEPYGAYLNEQFQQGGNNTPKTREDAANRFLKDLEEINAQLPKEG